MNAEFTKLCDDFLTKSLYPIAKKVIEIGDLSEYKVEELVNTFKTVSIGSGNNRVPSPSPFGSFAPPNSGAGISMFSSTGSGVSMLPPAGTGSGAGKKKSDKQRWLDKDQVINEITSGMKVCTYFSSRGQNRQKCCASFDVINDDPSCTTNNANGDWKLFRCKKCINHDFKISKPLDGTGALKIPLAQVGYNVPSTPPTNGLSSSYGDTLTGIPEPVKTVFNRHSWMEKNHYYLNDFDNFIFVKDSSTGAPVCIGKYLTKEGYSRKEYVQLSSSEEMELGSIKYSFSGTIIDNVHSNSSTVIPPPIPPQLPTLPKLPITLSKFAV